MERHFRSRTPRRRRRPDRGNEPFWKRPPRLWVQVDRCPREAAAAYAQALQIIEDRERYLADVYSPTTVELPGEQAKLLERLGKRPLQAS